ncbi:MAG: bacteriophage holin [Candidatus Methylomirabilales bacterium]
MKQALSMKGLSLALGLSWGGGVFLLGLAGSIGWGRPMVDVLGSVYLGFRPDLGGSLIGGVWAFVDGALGGIVIAWLYNRFS